MTMLFTPSAGTCMVDDCLIPAFILLVVDAKRVGYVCESCAWQFGDMIEHLPWGMRMYAKADLLDGWRLCQHPRDPWAGVFKRKDAL